MPRMSSEADVKAQIIPPSIAESETNLSVAPDHQSSIHVALSAEQLGSFGGMPITNTLLTSWLVVILLVSMAFVVGRRPQIVPSRFQLFLEDVIQFAQNFMQETLGDLKLVRIFFPLLASIFLFIATSNLLEFVPGVGSIVMHVGEETVPLLRSVNTDLNVTLALTIVVMVVIEIAGFVLLGLRKYSGKFINFSSPVNFVVGIIELVSEASRLVSFSFRLFGNIFAGEVLIAVITFFVPYVLPSTLMAFEMFVGIIQGAVFALLTLFFIKMAITDAHADEHSGHVVA